MRTRPPVTPHSVTMAIHVAELGQLFNPLDHSVLGERDLDSKTEEFLTSWARETKRDAQLSLQVYVDQPASVDQIAAVSSAITWFFNQRAVASRRRLRQLLRRGRVSLLIGIVFLGISVGIGGIVEAALADQRLGRVLGESLLIGGWVAMWRPLEIFLYDWWPILAEGQLFDRLGAMPVGIAPPESPP